MKWSYSDYLNTPVPVLDEVVRWMHDLAEEQRQQRRDAERRRR